MRQHVLMIVNATVQRIVLAVAKKTKIALVKIVLAKIAIVKNAIAQRMIALVEITANAVV